MKKSIVTLLAVACCLPALANAEEKGKERKGKERGNKMHEAMLKQFDKDGDGKLNEEEKTALKAAMAERKAATIKKYDTDGNGELSKEEKAAGMKAFKEEMLKKYDADGNGELSKEERQDAHKAGVKPPFFGRDGGHDRKRGPKGKRGSRGDKKEKAAE